MPNRSFRDLPTSGRGRACPLEPPGRELANPPADGDRCGSYVGAAGARYVDDMACGSGECFVSSVEDVIEPCPYFCGRPVLARVAGGVGKENIAPESEIDQSATMREKLRVVIVIGDAA